MVDAIPHKRPTLISAPSSPGGAAVRSLQFRLSDLHDALANAIGNDELHHESLHRLRVSSRKMSALLKLFRDLAPRKTVRKMGRMMKDLRRATDGTRDLDLLIQTLSRDESADHRRTIRELASKRQRAQRRAMKVVLRQIESGRIRRFGERLLARVGKHADEKSEIYSSLGVRLWQHFKRLFSAEPIRESGIAEMHKLRIRVKELRYQVEALSEVLPSGVAPPAVCLLETLQDRLGQVRDRAVSMHCLLEGMASSRDIRDIEKAWPALKTAHSGLVKSMRKLTRWWTGDRRDELRRAVREWVNGLDRPKAQGDV